MEQLRKWSATNPAPKITASFATAGLVVWTAGRLFFSTEPDRVILIDESGNVRLVLSKAAIQSMSRFEPLVDAPSEEAFKLDFLVGVSIVLSNGTLRLEERGD